MTTIDTVVVFSDARMVHTYGPGGYKAATSVREYYGDDAFAARLGERLGARAMVFDGPGLPEPGAGLPEPGAGTVVLCREDGLYRLQTSRCGSLDHVVLIHASRTRTLNQVETLGLAAAVERDPYQHWASSETVREPAIYGRLDVAAALGARLDDEPLTRGERSGRFQLPGTTDLVELLAAYLEAYGRSR